MSRELTSVVQTALAADEIEPFFAVDMLFDSPSELYLWTGVGDKIIDGKTYQGAGAMLQIAPIEETADISARGASLTMSGIPSSLLSHALSTQYQGRECKIYFGVMGSPSNYVEIFSGYMDQMTIDEGPETSTIALTVENKLVALERPAATRYTSGYQRSKYATVAPGSTPDKGLDFVEGLQNKRVIWGAIPE